MQVSGCRMLLAGPLLVYPHPAPSLYEGCLERSVGVFQAVLEDGILWIGEPVIGVCLQGGELPARPERSRAVSLVTSFGSWGPT